MPTESIDLSDLRCPACGGLICGFSPEDSCAGVRCLACGWGVVTTNTEHPHFQMARDETPYDVWVESSGHDRRRVISAVGNALCIGVKAARELIDRRSTRRVRSPGGGGPALALQDEGDRLGHPCAARVPMATGLTD